MAGTLKQKKLTTVTNNTSPSFLHQSRLPHAKCMWYHCIKCSRSGKCYSQIKEYCEEAMPRSLARVHPDMITNWFQFLELPLHIMSACRRAVGRKQSDSEAPIRLYPKTAFCREIAKLQSLVETTINTGRLMWFFFAEAVTRRTCSSHKLHFYPSTITEASWSLFVVAWSLASVDNILRLWVKEGLDLMRVKTESKSIATAVEVKNTKKQSSQPLSLVEADVSSDLFWQIMAELDPQTISLKESIIISTTL